MLTELYRNELTITEARQEEEGDRHPVEIGANRETRSAMQIDVDHCPIDMAFLEEGLARFEVSNGPRHLVPAVAHKVANGIGQQAIVLDDEDTGGHGLGCVHRGPF